MPNQNAAVENKTLENAGSHVIRDLAPSSLTGTTQMQTPEFSYCDLCHSLRAQSGIEKGHVSFGLNVSWRRVTAELPWCDEGTNTLSEEGKKQVVL